MDTDQNGQSGMDHSDNRDDIQSLFAVLPDQAASIASRKFKESLAQDATLSRHFTWVCCSKSGHPLSAGISQLSKTIHAANPAQSSDAFHQLVADITKGVRPGTVRLSRFDEVLRLYLDGEADKTGNNTIRGFALNYQVFTALTESVCATDRLTPSEYRLFYQLTGGLSLNEAATQDGLSIETKRAQFKSLSAKLDCHSQVDVARLALAVLMPQLLSLSYEGEDGLRVIEQFTTRHLEDNVRLVLQRLPSGRLLRYYEAGPQSGSPILVLHGMMVPMLLIGASTQLQEHGIRLIMPIRTGYLDNLPMDRLAHDSDLIIQQLSEIAEWLVHTGMQPLPLLGNSYGAALAIAFAKTYPQHVNRLILLSTNTGPIHNRDNTAGSRLFATIQRMANTPSMFRKIAWQFRGLYANQQTVRSVLRRLFTAPCDQAILDGQGKNAPVYAWFADSFQSSIVGIAEDFRFVTQNRLEDLASLEMPVDALHGRQDRFVCDSVIVQLMAQARNGRVTSLEGGHLAASSNPAETWAIIGRIISGHNPSG